MTKTTAHRSSHRIASHHIASHRIQCPLFAISVRARKRETSSPESKRCQSRRRKHNENLLVEMLDRFSSLRTIFNAIFFLNFQTLSLHLPIILILLLSS